MRILHFILGKANPDRANGVNQVIHGLAKYQSRAGHKVYVVGISSSMTIPYEKVQREDFEVECFKRFNSKTFTYIKKLIGDVDIIHLHGVWNNFNVRLGRYLESIRKPYIITAHCGYALDRIKQSNYLQKLLYHKLWQRRLYEHAAGVHALTREESTDIYRFCKNDNIFVVTNGVDPDTFDKYNYSVHKDRKKIKFGYLGRLSVEKNLDNLIKAVSLLPDKVKEQVELCLIGPIADNTEKLQNLTKKLRIEDNVKFVGGKYGEEKIQTLLDLDFYIHPAYSDVVGISVMEALALGVPTIVTRTSHMSYFAYKDAFIMVEPTAFDLSRGIRTAIERLKDRDKLSNNAKSLYLKQFNWKVAVESLIEEYEKVCR
ncbi:glycosyltransferase family 4 protein [uncultured Parabacteroides sp.]|uniref:glycosyltransferase family 4 protein n=1 Tax=uncultured Parabacteroides sp. TaxID=512312 RepID=UPI0028050089|nr:glycosyltransferase family 4 protein [uncultured Parabacteroides sp.]